MHFRMLASIGFHYEKLIKNSKNVGDGNRFDQSNKASATSFQSAYREVMREHNRVLRT